MKSMNNNYLGVHVFYNTADLRGVLLDCIEPLVRQLQARELLERYFFIRYWEGGAHVRLRLLPREHVSHEQIKSCVDREIERFLDERPSLFDPDPEVLGPLMRRLYVTEYGEEAYEREFGSAGIPLRPNNCYFYIPYIPEYARYGGVYCMEVSERHFEVASDVALEVLRNANSNVRTSTLGMAFQLMLHFASTYFQDRVKVAAFFRGFARFFEGPNVSPEMQAEINRIFARQSQRIDEQIGQLEATNARLCASRLGPLGKYIGSALWLREQVTRLYHDGLLDFGEPVGTWDHASMRLLTSYVHMTNNRLGILIAEEVYLANMIVNALEGRP
jgi:thiopeptide-type bacteriocin biosynthesis protein